MTAEGYLVSPPPPYHPSNFQHDKLFVWINKLQKIRKEEK